MRERHTAKIQSWLFGLGRTANLRRHLTPLGIDAKLCLEALGKGETLHCAPQKSKRQGR